MRHILQTHMDSNYGWFRLIGGTLILILVFTAPIVVLHITSAGPPTAETAVQAPLPPATYVSASKRDPFKSPLDPKKAEPPQQFDAAPARNRRPPGPSGMLIAEAQLAGVVQSPAGGWMALIVGDGSFTYFMQEGDRLYDGYIREIADGSVRFMRELKISSKVVEQVEVVKRIYPAP